MKTKDENFMNQAVACQRLIAAVIALAIKDACKGASKETIPTNTASALNFLFTHSDAYLTVLDIDPQQFRRRLLEYVHQKSTTAALTHNLTDFERRAFALNYQQWKKRSFHAVPIPYDEEDLCESY
jgi:hypothetical protein